MLDLNLRPSGQRSPPSGAWPACGHRGAINFLVSSDASFITGHGLVVDGGVMQRLNTMPHSRFPTLTIAC